MKPNLPPHRIPAALIGAELKKLAQLSSPRKFYLYSVLVGGTAGFFALGFSYLLGYFEQFFFRYFAGVELGTPRGEVSHAVGAIGEYSPIALFLLPVIGAFISGLLVQYFAPEAAGAGTDAALYTFHEEKGIARVRTPIIKALATFSVLSTGGSAGKEGPLSQIGASLGSLFGQFAGFGPKATRSLFLSGMAGALGAVFLAPLGAAISSVEILYKEDFESESLVPSILASVTGYFIYTSFEGMHQVFELPNSDFLSWNELLVYFILGILCYVAGFVFVKIYRTTGDIFRKIPLPLFVRTTIGGALVGLIGMFSYESMGTGFGFLQKLMDGDPLLGNSPLSQLFLDSGSSPFNIVLFLIVLTVLKMLTTSLTIGSGGSGGVFGPSLFIGGLIGAVVGIGAHEICPEFSSSYQPFIPVGMAGFFAGVANAPIAAVIMVSEMTGSYALLPPLLTVTMLSIIFSHKFSIYTTQKRNKFESPAHSWDITNHLLKNFSIGDTLPAITDHHHITIKTSLHAMFRQFKKLRTNNLPVVDKDGKYYGMIILGNLDGIAKKELLKLKPGILEMVEDIPALRMGESLSYALELLLTYEIEKIAVLDDTERFIGCATFRDILFGYHKKMTGKEPVTELSET